MNPFVYNAPVRRADFFNREEVMHKVINQLLGKAQGDVWLVGERQIGKTSLLQNSDIKFTDKEIKLCYKYTQGYPYFTQKLLSIMYDNKTMFTKEKEFEKMIKMEYGKEFESTIKAWGAQKMPPRTAEKLKNLAGKAGDNLFAVGLKTLEAYLKG